MIVEIHSYVRVFGFYKNFIFHFVQVWENTTPITPPLGCLSFLKKQDKRKSTTTSMIWRLLAVKFCFLLVYSME